MVVLKCLYCGSTRLSIHEDTKENEVYCCGCDSTLNIDMECELTEVTKK